MNSSDTVAPSQTRSLVTRCLLALKLALLSVFATNAAAGIVLWDTGAPLTEMADAAKREDWRAVPTDLFKLEADPLKSSSDPGYYGREYSFKGDMIFENEKLVAVFWSAKGKVLLYARGDQTGNAAASGHRWGEKVAEIAPLQMNGPIRRFNILRNAGDEVVAEAIFSQSGSADLSVLFSFGKSEVVEIKPGDPARGTISIQSPVEYGIVPSFVGDDLVFGPESAAESDTLFPPAESMFLTLLKGEQHQLVMTWPNGKQQIKLNFGPENDGKRPIASIDFETGGRSLFLAPQSAPGIWHQEDLDASYLEKKVVSQWNRPFPAKWQTQLSEAGVKTRFAFRESAGTVWRGVPGSYNYPVWFDDGKAIYHLSKKVPPKGQSVIYFVEGHDTPASILTPVDILKSTIGRADAEILLDPAGRKLRTHHRRGGDGVRRACTCGCTEAIQAIFEARQETGRKDEINEAITDMIYFVQCHVERIDEYQRFAAESLKFLKAKADSPQLKPYLEQVLPIVEQITQEYEVQKENMKSLDYAHELARQTMRLTEKNDAQNLSNYMALLKAWRGMGGAQDYVVAQCHALTRKLFQEASHAGATDPRTVELALEIRARCRQVLRNADGYEIWPNY